ncbi:hypothetical protein HYS94_04725 [Candidatus Daviesbacteria bacterium]|nr:hypothetical protein [Candidatus Daviesbacteria bacterium]
MPPDRKDNNPSQSEIGFISHVSRLVEQSVMARPDKARKAQRELITGLIQATSYEPKLVAFEQMQNYLQRGDPRTIRNATNFLWDLLNEVGKASEGKAIIVRISPSIRKVVERIGQNDKQIQRNQRLGQSLPNNYHNMVRLATSVKSAAEAGVDALEILTQAAPKSDQDLLERDREMQTHNLWVESLKRLTSLKSVTESGDVTTKSDKLIDLLKIEPVPHFLPRERLFTRMEEDVSLQILESMTYPLPEAALDQITAYLASILSKATFQTDKAVIGELFTDIIFFYDGSEFVTHNNRNLLVNISRWQERFIHQLLFEQDPNKISQIRKVIENLTELCTAMLVANALHWTSHPDESDPEYKGSDLLENLTHHPLASMALNAYNEQQQKDKFAFADEIGRNYFQTTLLPQLENRIRYLGASKNLEKAIAIIKEVLKEPYSTEHLHAIEDVFERNCGSEFINRLNIQSGELRELTRTVWDSTLERGLHFLPMEQGTNIVEFSEGSVPEILGLENITITRRGILTEWELAVTFTLKNTSIIVAGLLEQDGKLQLKAPVEQEIPGLYTMLNYIAVLAFHDLVIQESGESHQIRDKSKSEGEERKHSPFPTTSKAGRSQGRTLPRTQKDTDLIREVYRKTGFTPRVVEIHKTHLRGAREYQAAVELYQEALNQDVSEIALAWLREELRQMSRRENFYQPAEAKIKNLPARFKLEVITDPITGEERYLETWVVEHTSPRPTEEELKSPIKLFQRYYSHSSSLASLDQMKPWFVGE